MHPLLLSQPWADLRSIRDRLGAVFSGVRGDRRLDPTSQFVHALVGVRTYDAISDKAFLRLVERFRRWDDVADAPVEAIGTVLAGVTFADKKAAGLKIALRQIRARFGAVDLEFLADDPVDIALFRLEEIHGVHRKIAAATLNFSTLRRRAFVVDTHVLRVMRRFGFVSPTADTVAAFDAVMAAADGLDADDLYELHWHVKWLGQEACTHGRTWCFRCPLSDICLKRGIGEAQAAKR